MRLVVATQAGISLVDEEGGRVADVWAGDVRCLARAGARIYAGTGGAGVLRSDDGGETWRTVGLEEVGVRSIAADGDVVVVGAHPVAVHASDDGGESWRALRFPRRPYWWQPAFPPHTQGYVSALAVRGDVVLAGIEAFRGFRSADGGASWRPMRRGFARDSHALVFAHGRAYAGAGLGPAISADCGVAWRTVRSGLDRRYVMAIAVDPADRDCWYVAAAPIFKAHSPNAHAKVFRWADDEWIPVTEELRELPHALACPSPDTIVAGLRDGEIRRSTDRGRTWQRLATVDRVRDLV